MLVSDHLSLSNFRILAARLLSELLSVTTLVPQARPSRYNALPFLRYKKPWSKYMKQADLAYGLRHVEDGRVAVIFVHINIAAKTIAHRAWPPHIEHTL